ncbi:MAG: DinB family protein [Rhodospirillales bacterium]|nr:DinB family protein [Rhodospirillales bacterium]
MKQHILYLHKFSLNYAKLLMKDMPEGRACELAIPNAGHPVWLIGHLTIAADGARQLLGHDSAIPGDYRELFGRGSQPINDSSKYPPVSELLNEFEDAHERLSDAFEQVTEEQLAGENPNKRMREWFPTLGDMLIFMMTLHESVHLGQLSWWRRSIGLPHVI